MAVQDDETYWYMLVTYLLPTLSAKAVPDMLKYIENNLGVAEWSVYFLLVNINQIIDYFFKLYD